MKDYYSWVLDTNVQPEENKIKGGYKNETFKGINRN